MNNNPRVYGMTYHDWCGSWHPTDPTKYCCRTNWAHAAGTVEHICGLETWEGSYNDQQVGDMT
jgi:hypothetical protein